MGKIFKDNNSADKNTEAEPAPASVELKEIKEKRKLKYLRLDITNYYDYVSLMAEHRTNTEGKHISMTKYILRLIEADKQQNLKIYEKLEEIEQMKRTII